MYLSPRSARLRNIALAAVNGIVSLAILLIAPLGLAAVVINTALIVAATYITGTIADRLIRYLQGSAAPTSALNPQQRAQLEERDR
ncbi:MAG: hypothetical protein HC919_15705 [Oscillatoriales cyanobacterium SM2_2_1]|nr:hypothetical protein [Oscillatoriales cyanobacterium SM2_2_1]